MEARDAAAVRQGGGGTQGDNDGAGSWVPGTTSIGSSSSSLFSSTSSLTDDDDGQLGDDATYRSPPPGCRRPFSSSSSSSSSSLTSSSDKMQLDVAAAAVEGPLNELSTMLDHLPSLRTGLSEYYRGRSQSFTSLAGVSCIEDLAKKTAPYTRKRTKASRRCYAAALGAKNQLSKKTSRKVQGAADSQLLSRARNTKASSAAAADRLHTMARETQCPDASSRKK